jgi:hypothetical protein
MDKFMFWRVALMFLLALALPTTARAAAGDEAAVHGVLLDAAGRPVEGNPMTVKTPDGQLVMMPGTKEGGEFGLTGLPPGTYEFSAMSPGDGKTPLVSQKVTVAAGQQVKVEMRLTSNAPAANPLAPAKAPAANTPPAVAVAPAAAAGSTDSEGDGSAWKMSMIAGFVTLTICLAGAIYFGRRSRQQVSG